MHVMKARGNHFDTLELFSGIPGLDVDTEIRSYRYIQQYQGSSFDQEPLRQLLVHIDDL